MLYCVPQKYCTDEWEWHLNRAGIGDAVRGAAIIKLNKTPGKKCLVLCDRRANNGVSVCRNLQFVDSVIALPQPLLLRRLPELLYNSRKGLTHSEAGMYAQYLLRYWELHYDAGVPYRLEPADFRSQSMREELPARYIVTQPSTTATKVHAMPDVTTELLRASDLPVVVIGSVADKRQYAMPSWVIDLRGMTSIAEAMWVIACSSGVVSAETWSPLLGTQLGVPSLIGCRTVYLDGYSKYVRRDWPDLRYADVMEDLPAWEHQLARVIADAKTYTPVAC